jgi:ABC-type oligopeptide transport system ATPase subunit
LAIASHTNSAAVSDSASASPARFSTEPEFLVADEPVSALDVSVQAQVLSVLADLRSRLCLGMLFISYDLPVVRSLCDRAIVLYLGRVMDEGPAADVLATPLHPYTRALISAVPTLDPTRRMRILLQATRQVLSILLQVACSVRAARSRSRSVARWYQHCVPSERRITRLYKG